MQCSPHRARPPPTAQEDPGCMSALLLTGGLCQLIFLSSQTAHMRLWWCRSLCQVPWATSPCRDSLLPWWLWAVLASLEQQWELAAAVGCAEHLPYFCSSGQLCSYQLRLPADTTYAPLSPGSMLLQCLHRLAVLLFWAFPLAWQVRADGRWCRAGLWVFSCCP